jgi:hypothetical protein
LTENIQKFLAAAGVFCFLFFGLSSVSPLLLLRGASTLEQKRKRQSWLNG